MTFAALDVGNTQTVLGLNRDGEWVGRYRLASAVERTADEYGVLIRGLLADSPVRPEDVDGVIVSSVVPPLRRTLEQLSVGVFGTEALFVEPGVKTGLPIRYDNPTEVGADRIANAVAARARFGVPVVAADFGTATTFDVVSGQGEYVGGLIAPGIQLSAEALFRRASRLHKVELRVPDDVVAQHTSGALQSGLYYGFLGLVDGILERLHEEFTDLQAVVATGGDASLVASASRYIDHVDPDLTLEGLRLIYERNR